MPPTLRTALDEVNDGKSLLGMIFRLTHDEWGEEGHALLLHNRYSAEYGAYNLTTGKDTLPIAEAEEDYITLRTSSIQDLSPQEKANLDSFKKRMQDRKTYQTA